MMNLEKFKYLPTKYWISPSHPPPESGQYLVYKEMMMGDDEQGIMLGWWNGRKNEWIVGGYSSRIRMWRFLSDSDESVIIDLGMLNDVTLTAALDDVIAANERLAILLELKQ